VNELLKLGEVKVGDSQYRLLALFARNAQLIYE
jgi:hypothetical protein